jgi:hypothetical protein
LPIDARANFALSFIEVGPSPPGSGLTLTLIAGGAALMPATPFNATCWPPGVAPSRQNAEIVRVSNITGSAVTLSARAQESTSAQEIEAGWQFANMLTAGTITSLAEAITAAEATALADAASAETKAIAAAATKANTAQAAAEAASIPLTQKGAAGGVASLTAGSIGAQPPAYHASTHAPAGSDPLTTADLPASVESSSRQLKQFGIVGGEENETAKWQAMIKAVSEAGGGLITVPAGTYRMCNVYMEPGVYLRLLPGAIFRYALTAAGESGAPSIFTFGTESQTSTNFVEDVGIFGEFVVNGSDLGAAPRYEIHGNPVGLLLTNVKNFYIDRVRAINLPGSAGNAINAHANGGGSRICPTQGYIGRVEHVESLWGGNSAIQLGAMRDVIVGYAGIEGLGCAFRNEAHHSGPENNVQGICENVECLLASADMSAVGKWQAVTGVAATGVLKTTTPHGYTVGQAIQFREKEGPTGGTLKEETYYYVLEVLSETTFTVALTYGGAKVTWTGELAAGYAGMHGTAAYILAHDETTIRRVKIHSIRARGGSDGLQTSHEASSKVRGCTVADLDVEGGGRLVTAPNGVQLEYPGFTIGPGEVREAAGIGMVALPYATYINPRAKECLGVGIKDLALPEGAKAWTRIIGGVMQRNRVNGYEQANYGLYELLACEALDPPTSKGANQLSAEESLYESGLETLWTLVAATKARKRSGALGGHAHTLEVEAGTGGSCEVRNATEAHSCEAGKATYVAAEAWAQGAVASQAARIKVKWYNAAKELIGESNTINTTLAKEAWTKISGYVEAPTGAVTYTMVLIVAKAAESEKFNWYKMEGAQGTGVAPLQSYGVSVAVGLVTRVIGGKFSENGVAEYTGAGHVEAPTFSNVH